MVYLHLRGSACSWLPHSTQCHVGKLSHMCSCQCSGVAKALRIHQLVLTLCQAMKCALHADARTRPEFLTQVKVFAGRLFPWQVATVAQHRLLTNHPCLRHC